MFSKKTILLGCSMLFVAAGIFAQRTPASSQNNSTQTSNIQTVQQVDSNVQSTPAEQEKQFVDYRADLIKPVKVGDSSAVNLLGHVVFFHNGAVITCDSAVRYNSMMMDCFNNVIINKDSTFIYGDKADYNGYINTARVYAPLVKTVDRDAVLYTYNFSFNTKDDVGYYTGGGTITQKDNMIESDKGYYYTSTRDIVGVGNVEMRNKDYIMKSDSVSYNLDSEIAKFYTRSYIWNDNLEMLSALKGEYDTKGDKYFFHDSVYIITTNQEVWADTIHYNTQSEDALLLGNVQIRDEEQHAMAFGDYVQYWGGPGNALLTRNPSVLNFDPQEPDTLYMRSDSMFIFTIQRSDSAALSDSLAMADSLVLADSTAMSESGVENMLKGNSNVADIVSVDKEIKVESDSILNIEETISVEPKLSRRELKQERARQKRLARQQARAEKIKARQEKRDRMVAEAMAQFEKQHNDTLIPIDSLPEYSEESVIPDSITTTENAAAKTDSVSREMRAYNNVRIYRSDFQAVCDSLVGFSVDSTLYMYKDPVMWNENNQVKSQFVQVLTKNQKIERALFTGEPIMGSDVDGMHYNQVKGKTMEAFFNSGVIHKMDVVGNGQTYYYMEDGDSTDRYVNGFATVECANITFLFAEKKIDKIIWRGNPNYAIYPMDKIPADQAQVLPGFVWEADRKPTKSSVFTRVILPSERSYYQSVELPDYPITGKINEDKKRLIESGTWFDRRDDISDEAKEFIRELGYIR